MKLVLLFICVVYFLATVTAIYDDGYYYVYYDDDDDLRNDLHDGYLSPPENLVVDAENTSTKLFVYWDHPANGSEFVKYYKIDWRSHPTGQDKTNGPETGYVIQGLLPCNQYTVTVTAITTNHGDSSIIGSGDTQDDVPGMPTSLQCLVLNSTAIDVTWVRPTYSCPITSYLLTGNGYSLWNNQSDEIYDDILVNKQIDHLTNLIPYAVYDLSVYAVNDFGLSASASCTPTTNQAAPGPPTNVEAVEASISSLYVTWLPPDERNGILIQYFVRVWVDSELLTEVGTLSNDTHIVIYNLEQCINYDITVLAETGGGNGTESIPGSGFIPGTPEYENPRCFQTSSDTIFVDWNVTNPLCDIGEVITNVTWEIVILWIEGSDVISDVAQTFNNSYEINEFYYYSTYNITISDASGANGVFCVTETSQGAPSEPANLNCATNDATSITLEWDPPVEINGVIDLYTVRMSGSENNVNGDTTSYKVTGLTPSTSYDFSVTASTKDGNESYEGPAANITASTTEVTTTTTTSVVTEVFTEPVTYSSTSFPPYYPPPSTSHVGAIVGGVIGGILLICICIGLGMYISNKKKHSKAQTKF